MNYIKKIQAQNEVYLEGLQSLKRYVSSPKFIGDGRDYVNPKDILLRVEETLNAACDILVKEIENNG